MASPYTWNALGQLGTSFGAANLGMKQALQNKSIQGKQQELENKLAMDTLALSREKFSHEKLQDDLKWIDKEAESGNEGMRVLANMLEGSTKASDPYTRGLYASAIAKQAKILKLEDITPDKAKQLVETKITLKPTEKLEAGRFLSTQTPEAGDNWRTYLGDPDMPATSPMATPNALLGYQGGRERMSYQAANAAGDAVRKRMTDLVATQPDQAANPQGYAQFTAEILRLREEEKYYSSIRDQYLATPGQMPTPTPTPAPAPTDASQPPPAPKVAVTETTNALALPGTSPARVSGFPVLPPMPGQTGSLPYISPGEPVAGRKARQQSATQFDTTNQFKTADDARADKTLNIAETEHGWKKTDRETKLAEEARKKKEAGRQREQGKASPEERAKWANLGLSTTLIRQAPQAIRNIISDNLGEGKGIGFDSNTKTYVYNKGKAADRARRAFSAQEKRELEKNRAERAGKKKSTGKQPGKVSYLDAVTKARDNREVDRLVEKSLANGKSYKAIYEALVKDKVIRR